jgi:hypothetical protein
MTAKILGLDRKTDWFRNPSVNPRHTAGVRYGRLARQTCFHEPPTLEEGAEWRESVRPRRRTTARRRAL